MRKVYDIGINDLRTNWMNENKTNKRIYDTWHNMLRRCYSEEWLKKHPSYKGCTVCNRWLILSNFVEDISKIDNYDFWLNNPNKRIALDKDIKSNGQNKQYCLKECAFVTLTENTKQANKTRDNSYLQGENNPFYGKHHSEETIEKMRKPKTEEHKRKISENHADVKGKNHPRSKSIVGVNLLTGEIIKFDYISQAKEKGFVNSYAITLCCKGLKNNYKGYIWKYYEEWLKDERN